MAEVRDPGSFQSAETLRWQHEVRILTPEQFAYRRDRLGRLIDPPSGQIGLPTVHRDAETDFVLGDAPGYELARRVGREWAFAYCAAVLGETFEPADFVRKIGRVAAYYAGLSEEAAVWSATEPYTSIQVEVDGELSALRCCLEEFGQSRIVKQIQHQYMG